MWGSRGGRIALSLTFLGIAAWILIRAFTDTDDFFAESRSYAAFIAAPVLVLVFGVVLGETIRDIVRGENHRPWMTRDSFQRPSVIVGVAYAAVMVVVLVLWRG
jgi:hypothetical protein